MNQAALSNGRSVLSPRLAAAKRNGAAGGRATAAKYSKEERERWGEKGGQAVLARFGSEFYKHIRQRRKTWRKRNTEALRSQL